MLINKIRISKKQLLVSKQEGNESFFRQKKSRESNNSSLRRHVEFKPLILATSVKKEKVSQEKK